MDTEKLYLITGIIILRFFLIILLTFTIVCAILFYIPGIIYKLNNRFFKELKQVWVLTKK